MVDWCTNNDLELNVVKTKEMIIDFRKNKTAMTPLAIREQTSRTCGVIKIPGHYHRQHLKLVKWDISAETITEKA